MENNNNPSFRSWLFSTHEMVEKTVGIVVLTIEVYAILQEVFQTEHKALLTQILNLLFLVFIYFYLRIYFAKRFSVNSDNADVARVLRLSPSSHRREKISELVFHANTFISQLKNINYFVLATAGLYVLFLSQYALDKLVEQHKLYIDADVSKYVFHLLIDLFSYAGAFFLLRCFFVMYLPTIDKNGNSILNKKTGIYVLLGVAFMIFDACIMTKWYGLFLTGFLCGLVNAVIFVLFIARFENKILDIPPIILAILYVYAILQTCLPFVTGDVFGGNMLAIIDQFKPLAVTPPVTHTDLIVSHLLNQKEMFDVLAGRFSTIVLTICLVGKITLSAVLLYVLNTKRIFYYFMTLRRIHEEEAKSWGKFFPLIEAFPVEPETFSITYEPNPDSTYTARLPNLFEHVTGKGLTPEEAKEELLNEIRGAENS